MLLNLQILSFHIEIPNVYLIYKQESLYKSLTQIQNLLNFVILKIDSPLT